MKRHLTILVAAVALTLFAGTAWAYWSTSSVPGGGGAAGASTVGPGATPTVSAAAANLTVSWPASTLANGVPVSGYLVKRYDATTSAVQTVLAGCAGTLAATSCVENGVPDGSWRYTVTPLFAANWQGAESPKSTTVTIDTTPPPAPVFVSISSDTGTSATDRITSTASQTLTGLAEPLSTVTVRRDATVLGTAIANASGTFTFGVTLTPGDNTFKATATDTAGNTSVASAGFTVTLDTVEPFTVVISPSDGAWRTSGAWSVTANDALSGIAQVSYRVDAGGYANLAASNGTPVSPPALGDGVHTVYAYATDVAGKSTSATPVNATIKVDSIKPTAAITLAPTGPGGWRVSGSASITGSDATSGVDHVEYRIDSGSFVSIASGATFTVPEGTHSVTYRAVDVAGNVGDNVTVSDVKVDSVKPQSSVTPAGSASWRNSGTVTLSATDATSGVASIGYKLDGAATYTTYAGPLSLADGTHTLVFRALDVAGNVEADNTATIKVDTQLPAATMSQSIANGQPTITGSDQPALSGVASVSYRVGGTGPYTTVAGTSTTLNLPTGTHTVWRYATDNAGNQSAPVSSSVTVDATGPSVSYVRPADGASGTSWTSIDCTFLGFGTQRICTDVSDPNGVASVSFQLVRPDGRCYNGSAFVVGPCSAQPMGALLGRYYSDQIAAATMNAVEGEFTLSIITTDDLGNVSTSTTHFTIDSANPTATITPADSATYRTSGSVTITGNDANGIASVSYRVDANSGAFTTVAGSTATFTLPDGTHTVDYYVTDLAGKTSGQVDNSRVNVDTVAPAIGSIEPTNESGGWAAIDCATQNNRLCATVSDAGSGVGAVTMTLTRGARCWDGTTTTPFSQTSCAPVSMTINGGVYRSPTLTWANNTNQDNFINGTYTLTVTATDNAGNVATQTRMFIITGG